jgi:hypothetical protein
MEEVEFVPPQSMEQAEERKRLLIKETEEIDAQLGDPFQKDKKAKQPGGYDGWRNTAIRAKLYRLQELRLLKQWIKDYYRELISS